MTYDVVLSGGWTLSHKIEDPCRSSAPRYMFPSYLSLLGGRDMNSPKAIFRHALDRAFISNGLQTRHGLINQTSIQHYGRRSYRLYSRKYHGLILKLPCDSLSVVSVKRWALETAYGGSMWALTGHKPSVFSKIRVFILKITRQCLILVMHNHIASL